MSKSLASKIIGFIGAGQMATAIARGLTSSGILTPEQIVMHDVNEEAMRKCQNNGFRAVKSNQEVHDNASVIFFAVKPQYLEAAIKGVNFANEGKLIISLCAGISLRQLCDLVDTKERRIIRVMPNTPCLVNQSATAFCLAAEHGQPEDILIVKEMMGALGVVHQVCENDMDAVTGLSGSGPAYVYMLVEALSDAGVFKGLSRDVSTSLAVQTVIGAATMVQKTKLHPAVLKEHVASPGGTTIAGIVRLEEAGFRSAVISAVDAASRRSKELGKVSLETLDSSRSRN